MRGALIANALVLVSGCSLGVPRVRYGEPQTLPLVHVAMDRHRFYTVLDGRPDEVWFVDTGYSHSTCDDGLIADRGLKTHGKVRIRGELGDVVGQRARLPPFSIAGHEILDLTCVVRDLDTTSSIRDTPEVRIAGVIGTDVLRPFRVTLDPGRGELTLLPRGTDPIGAHGPGVVQLRREHRIGMRPLVPVSVAGDLRWLIVDTGATGVYIDGDELGAAPTEVHRDVPVHGTGEAGTVRRDLRIYTVDLDLGGTDLAEVRVGHREASAGAAGLLGLEVLRRFRQEYDFASRRARFTPVETTSERSWRAWQLSLVGVEQ